MLSNMSLKSNQFFLRKILSTRYGLVGTRFSILGTRIGSLKHLEKPGEAIIPISALVLRISATKSQVNVTVPNFNSV